MSCTETGSPQLNSVDGQRNLAQVCLFHELDGAMQWNPRMDTAQGTDRRMQSDG